MNNAIEQETTCAVLRFDPEHGLEIHVKHGLQITVPMVQEVLDAREQLAAHKAYSVLVMLPEDSSIDPDVLLYDHYLSRGLEDCTIAVAWDAAGGLNRVLVDVYYTYFPKEFPARTFRTEAEARSWLAAQVDLSKRSGFTAPSDRSVT